MFSDTSNIYWIHYAFLRTENFERLGINKYIEIKKAISSFVYRCLKKSYKDKNIIISSGVAA